MWHWASGQVSQAWARGCQLAASNDGCVVQHLNASLQDDGFLNRYYTYLNSPNMEQEVSPIPRNISDEVYQMCNPWSGNKGQQDGRTYSYGVYFDTCMPSSLPRNQPSAAFVPPWRSVDPSLPKWRKVASNAAWLLWLRLGYFRGRIMQVICQLAGSAHQQSMLPKPSHTLLQ